MAENDEQSNHCHRESEEAHSYILPYSHLLNHFLGRTERVKGGVAGICQRTVDALCAAQDDVLMMGVPSSA